MHMFHILSNPKNGYGQPINMYIGKKNEENNSQME